MLKIFGLAVFLAVMAASATPAPAHVATTNRAIAVEFKTANIGDGIVIHYAQEGSGTPVIFVHGSLADYGYWKDQVDAFAKNYRAIAYSRRYNFPNTNPARPGYSAVVDAADLAAFIRKLDLGRVDIVGHSYGALTALFLAARHPELVRAVVLAEPPAVSLLRNLPGASASIGTAQYTDIQRRLVAPMKAAYRRGDRVGGVSTFIDYVFNDPHGWEHMSQSDRDATMRDSHEWDVMLTTGTLFPVIEPKAVREIHVPVLVMTGSKTYPFLQSIDAELVRLLPNNRAVTIRGAGHQMWYQDPTLCRDLTEDFFRRNDGVNPSDTP